VSFSLFPLKKGHVFLPTTAESFFTKLNKTTEKNFDFGRSFNVSGESNKHEYQSEINGSNFKLRRIQKPGYKSSLFVGTLVYGKVIESKDIIILKYFAVFNLFTNIIFLIILIAGLYCTFVFLNSGLRDYTIVLMFLCVYLVFLIGFDIEVSDDINFVDSIIRSYNVPT
jgi:hypothetical protein